MLAAPQLISINVGVDWLTMTLPKEAKSSQKWLNAALECVEGVKDAGNELRYIDRLGYSGIGTDHCFVGESSDRIMATFQSHYAHSAANVLHRSDCNVSRLDVRVDCQYDRMPINIGKRAYREAMAYNNTLDAHKRRKIWIIVGSDGGDTVYTGAHSSEQQGCLYNKEVESSDKVYEHTWRYEVKLKNKHAYSLYSQYAIQHNYSIHFLSDFVAIWYESRAIEAPWPYDESNLPLPPKAEVPTDVARKLRWLKEQVKPSVEYLLSVTDYDTVLAALGLPNGLHVSGSPDQAGDAKALGDTRAP